MIRRLSTRYPRSENSSSRDCTTIEMARAKTAKTSQPANTKNSKTIASRTLPFLASTTAITSLLAASAFVSPHHAREALAADPQNGNKYDTVARGNSNDYSLSDNANGFDSLARVSDRREDRGLPNGAAPSRIFLTESELSRMGKIRLASNPVGGLALDNPPTLKTQLGDRFVDRTEGGNFVFYTVDPELQQYVDRLVDSAHANHTAIVAMNPRTGAVLAIAGKSNSIPNIEYHAGFPAASLFKVVTAAAAVEQAGIQPSSEISFRGGTYTLNESNYLPNQRLDTRVMSVAEALGRSCNPVFGQLGIRYLNTPALSRYAKLFGFNKDLGFEVKMARSTAAIPSQDQFEFSRTAAGFGEVTMSPIHAAAFMSGVANGGLLPRPRVVEKVVSPDGAVLHRGQPEALHRIVTSSTAATIMDMMEYTTTVGTSKREFLAASNRPTMGGIRVAAKTGTLSGDNPKGLNNWFIAAAPIENPQLAIAVITVDAGYSSKASHLGRRVFEKFFDIAPERLVPPAPAPKRSVSRSKSAKTHLVKGKGGKTTRTIYAKKGGKSKVIVSKAPQKKRR